jgi:cyclase
MLKKRLIVFLVIRNGLIVQSVGFKKYYPIGRPEFPIEFVARWDVDEIVVVDISANIESRTISAELLKLISEKCFVPLTVGGGIKSVEDVRGLTSAGADKVVINSEAVKNPRIVTEVARVYGSQCVVISIDCRLESDGTYQVYIESGSKPTGLSPQEWAATVEELGAGEIFLNSIDRDGSKLGYDLRLIKSITESVSIPVIACGGVGRFSDFSKAITEGNASAVAASNIFHFVEHSTILAKAHLLQDGIDIRIDSESSYLGRDFDENGRLVMLKSERLNEIFLKRGTKSIV